MGKENKQKIQSIKRKCGSKQHKLRFMASRQNPAPTQSPSHKGKSGDWVMGGKLHHLKTPPTRVQLDHNADSVSFRVAPSEPSNAIELRQRIRKGRCVWLCSRMKKLLTTSGTKSRSLWHIICWHAFKTPPVYVVVAS
jgi:hypothetical protein